MPITYKRINVYLDPDKYKQFQHLLIEKGYRSLSDYVRKTIDKVLQDNEIKSDKDNTSGTIS